MLQQRFAVAQQALSVNRSVSSETDLLKLENAKLWERNEVLVRKNEDLRHVAVDAQRQLLRANAENGELYPYKVGDMPWPPYHHDGN